MMELSNRYSPQEVEAKWYAHWLRQGHFFSKPDEREPYTIVIPPPNVTGVLHMGHMLNNTVQDIYIRKARLEGKNACWVPGTDHASIATEAKVVKMLRDQGIRKSDIGREEFLRHAFDWKEKYGGIILEQLKRLGASCDWQRTRFTMEESLSRAVIYVFVDLYRKGRIYRGKRMTNWDPEAKTVLSNEEVVYQEENAQLFHLRYPLEQDPSQGIVIATQRPETIMADTAVAVHPEDERYRHLIGQRVLIPLIDKPIPIIADAYVDREFGTGALKVTPAHDQNDFEIGLRHNLEVIDILHDDGTLNEQAIILVGEDRFAARKKIKTLLEQSGHLVKLEDYRTKIGRSERTNAVVEPRLTLQWFLDMKDFAASALAAVRNGEVKFHPDGMWNMYYQWLREENVRDWCISRQLWWGQRIPAWYLKYENPGEDQRVFVALSAEEALEQARKATGKPGLSLDDLVQEEDVVDTWFSSWLWPISVFDGFERQDELRYYYPTNLLVTGWDIMFFWVARMIMAGYEWGPELLGPDLAKQKGVFPFKDVYFTGMVRDNKRRKMSKSLGNSPDAIALLDTYGADGVRFGLLASTVAGNDVVFDAPFDPQTGEILNESKLCEQGRNFCNKMWNALRLIKGWATTGQPADADAAAIQQLAGKWMEHRLNVSIERWQTALDEYRLSDALMTLYKLIWDDFCSWYLEMIKPAYGEPLPAAVVETAVSLYERMVVLLHPFMPFVTEEIWHHLRERAPGQDCIVASVPVAGAYDEAFLQLIEEAKEVVTGVREVRNNYGIKMKDPLRVWVQESRTASGLFHTPGLRELIVKMAILDSFDLTDTEIQGAATFLSGKDKFYVLLEQGFDKEEECARLQKEREYYLGFIQSVEAKLSNERFVSGAPEPVVARERQKLADGQAKLRMVEEALAQLGCN